MAISLDGAAGESKEGKGGRTWQFSKTKMCKFQIIGMCAKGEQCPFAHDKQEMRPLPDLTCTKLCKTLIQTGICDDPSCKYAHTKEELRATSTFHKTKLCRFSQIGHCALGSKCNFAHSSAEIRKLEASAAGIGMDVYGQQQQPEHFFGATAPFNPEAMHFQEQLAMARQLQQSGLLRGLMPGQPQYLPAPSLVPGVGMAPGVDVVQEAAVMREQLALQQQQLLELQQQQAQLIQAQAQQQARQRMPQPQQRPPAGFPAPPRPSQDQHQQFQQKRKQDRGGRNKQHPKDSVPVVAAPTPTPTVAGAGGRGMPVRGRPAQADAGALEVIQDPTAAAAAASPAASAASAAAAQAEGMPGASASSTGATGIAGAGGAASGMPGRVLYPKIGMGIRQSASMPHMAELGQDSNSAAGPEGFNNNPAYVTQTASAFHVKNTFLELGTIGGPLRSIRSAAARLDRLADGPVSEAEELLGLAGSASSLEAAGLGGGLGPPIHGLLSEADSATTAASGGGMGAVGKGAGAGDGSGADLGGAEASGAGPDGWDGSSSLFKDNFAVSQKEDVWQVKNTFLTFSPQSKPIRSVRTAEGALCTLGALDDEEAS